ncbi:hypothetical protein [Streptomyces sp. CBMA152]|uniref:hypothetical protein n=1 Tax=Streptomyces sp. CBMA152 TaxID=1896312 RepID=UPI0016602F7D|nr:hypothetical protein [Streptomyces sp. CBMA152]MBD0742172.1 hypothetical protein [Streptomyces sp. CBMA152]
MPSTSRIDLLDLYAPERVADDGFRPFCTAVAMTEPVDYVLSDETVAALDHTDKDSGWRRRARTAGGVLTTDDPLVGAVGALAARAAARPDDRMLRWVEPYLRQVSDHEYRIDLPDRPCVLGGGRGRAQMWRTARETVSGACESASRWAAHCHSTDVPVDVVIATMHFWPVIALVDQHYAGPTCAAEVGKLAQVALDHLHPHLDRPGAVEQVWVPDLGNLVANMATRLTSHYHDPSVVPLPDRLAMRAVDSGSDAQVAQNAFYAGLSSHPLLDEWKIATALAHDMWQIRHDETKSGDDFNSCSMLLREGVKVEELADYLTYLTCSHDLPPAIRHCFDAWTVMTLASQRHATRLPKAPPRRDRLWVPATVARVRQAIGAAGADAPFAEADSSLSGADLDPADIERLLAPENCRSYTACIDSTAEANRMWREYVYRFDVIPELLSRSKYAQAG